MKKLPHILCALAITTLAACNKETEVTGSTATITAYMDEIVCTKTSLQDGLAIRWSGSDKIAILSGGKFHESSGTLIKDGGRIAEFKISSAASGATLALYPCDNAASLSQQGAQTTEQPGAQTTELQGVQTTLQATQSAVENGFASGLNPALATVSSTSAPVYFHNIGALVSVTPGCEGIRKISLSALDGSPLAGPCCISLDGETPVCIPSGTNTSVELEGYFKSGKTYFFVIFPGTYKGLKLTLTNSLGQTVTLTYPDTISMRSNECLALEPLEDLSDRFGDQPITAWDRFINANEDNILPDFSYAGYSHGEQAPPPTDQLGYTTYNVTNYGAIPDDGKSDRDAFIACLTAIFGAPTINSVGDLIFPHREQARAVIQFPEGEFILHAEGDQHESKTIYIRSGALVLKGAGRDATTLTMAQANQPRSSALYSSPVMLDFKHMSAPAKLADITKNAGKGSFAVTVSSAAGLGEGDWVCLMMEDNSPQAVEDELKPYKLDSQWTELSEQGVRVTDFHQIKSIKGNIVTFCEPLMHEVNAQYGWTINTYPHYSEVGIEDLTFKGNAKPDYVHHASWEDDGAFKPLNITRIVNGWMRRVGFVSVSEAASIIYCSNFSVYDVTIGGNRGHSAIRSQESSRVFIGKVRDSSGEGLGQDHAVGVSKPAIGTVLWRNTWGSESCFEAHASQPRATLLDCCSGGWQQMHCGGDRTMLPNHLDDLVIWNFEALNSFPGIWDWWTLEGLSWKFLPPVIVGFHGGECTFSAESVKYEESHGTAVADPDHAPESLYEAQLARRLGSVPAWLLDLKQ